jgi:membrane-bound metal-dependent hydrolase YbcI (DUF457 family)
VYAGHVALALLAKGARPRIPLAVLVPVAFAPDWIEWILGALGRPNRELSHSLVSVAVGATLVAVLYWMATKAPRDAAVVWLTYVSHWPADFITGYKPTWPGGPTIGLGIYGNPVADIVVEWSLIMICWLVYRRSLPPKGRSAKVGWLMPAGLMAMQIAFYAIQIPEVKEQVREVIGRIETADPSLHSG